MPKKKAPKNAFYFYMQHYLDKEKKKGRHIQWADAPAAASPSWKDMSKGERAGFEKMAREDKVKSKLNPREHEIYTSQGVPYSQVRQEQQDAIRKFENMQQRISQLVEDGFLSNTIHEQPFYFMAGVYFCKTNDNVFVPAEVALTNFNLEHGIIKKYHSFVNPGAIPIGYAFEAMDHSSKTHHLPPPPKAMGEVSLYKIRERIVEFITPKNGFNKTDDTENKLVIFAKRDIIPMLDSFIKQFYDEFKQEKDIEIFHLEELFFVLKKKSQEFGVKGVVSVANIHIANILLTSDPFINLDGLGCQFHDDEDVSQYCALSQVSRWCFTFADNICPELDIDLMPGFHLPKNADVTPQVPMVDMRNGETSGERDNYLARSRQCNSRGNGPRRTPSPKAAPPPPKWSTVSVATTASDNNSDDDEQSLVGGSTYSNSFSNRSSDYDGNRRSAPNNDVFDELPTTIRRGAGRGKPIFPEDKVGFPPLGTRRR